MRTLLSLLLLVPLAAVAGPAALQTGSQAERLYDLATREAQYRKLQSMPAVQVSYQAFGRVRLVEGSTAIFIPGLTSLKAGDSATLVMRELGSLLMASKSEGLKVSSIQNRNQVVGGRDIGGGYDLFMDQTIDGIPVIDAGLNIRTSRDGEITAISSRFVPHGNASRHPRLSIGGAKARMIEDLVAGELAVAGSVVVADQGTVAFWTDEGRLDKPVLVWLLQASFKTPDGRTETATIAVDATTGEVRRIASDVHGLNRTVWSLNQNPDYTATRTLLWNEGSPQTSDPQGFAVYNDVQAARNIWANVGWNWDTIHLAVHWGDVTNALSVRLNGAPFLIFGDQVAQLDAVAHEYAHEIFVTRAPPQQGWWWSEWYAMNEFFADLSAVLVDLQANAGYPTSLDANWQITSLNLRDLKDPKSTAVYQYWLTQHQDWYPSKRHCCSRAQMAYANSTIFGHALYLMKVGGLHRRVGQPVPGGVIPAIPVVPLADNGLLQVIFTQGLQNMKFYNLEANAVNLKAATSSAANVLAGPSVATETVQKAWSAVGIQGDCSGPPPTPNPDINSWYCKGKYDISWAQSPGVTYHGMLVPYQFGWDVYGKTSVDGPVSSCQTNFSSNRRFRMRACNGCGCSNWTPDYYLEYYSPCL